MNSIPVDACLWVCMRTSIVGTMKFCRRRFPNSLEKLKFTGDMFMFNLTGKAFTEKAKVSHFEISAKKRWINTKTKESRNGLSLFKPNLDIRFTFSSHFETNKYFSSLWGSSSSKNTPYAQCAKWMRCKWRISIEIHYDLVTTLFFLCSSERGRVFQWFFHKLHKRHLIVTWETDFSSFLASHQNRTLNGLYVLFALFHQKRKMIIILLKSQLDRAMRFRTW